MIYYIYGLTCPVEKTIKYVGQSKNPETRYKQHLRDAEKKSNTEKQKWIRGLNDKKIKPGIIILEKTEDEVQARILEEKYVIENIKTVLNIHMPGKGSLSVSHYKKTGHLK